MPVTTKARGSSKLTEEELESIKACKTPTDWAAVQARVKEVRGGEYPSDWYERVLAPGEARRVIRSVAAVASTTSKHSQLMRLTDALQWIQSPSATGVSQIRTVLVESERAAPDGLRDQSMDDSTWRAAQRVVMAAEQLQMTLRHLEEQIARKRQEG